MYSLISDISCKVTGYNSLTQRDWSKRRAQMKNTWISLGRENWRDILGGDETIRAWVRRWQEGKSTKRKLERREFGGQVEIWRKGNSKESTRLTPANTPNNDGCITSVSHPLWLGGICSGGTETPVQTHSLWTTGCSVSGKCRSIGD